MWPTHCTHCNAFPCRVLAGGTLFDRFLHWIRRRGAPEPAGHHPTSKMGPTTLVGLHGIACYAHRIDSGSDRHARRGLYTLRPRAKLVERLTFRSLAVVPDLSSRHCRLHTDQTMDIVPHSQW